VLQEHDETEESGAREPAARAVDANEFEVPSGMVNEQHQAPSRAADPPRVQRGPAHMAPGCRGGDLRERATFAARASCIPMSVAKKEGTEAQDADIQKKIQEIAELRGQAAEAIRGYPDRDDAINVEDTHPRREDARVPMERLKLIEEKPGEAKAEAAPAAEAAPRRGGAEDAEEEEQEEEGRVPKPYPRGLRGPRSSTPHSVVQPESPVKRSFLAVLLVGCAAERVRRRPTLCGRSSTTSGRASRTKPRSTRCSGTSSPESRSP
jgi:hypothetical protein